MNALRLAILQTIQQFDGQYGWYQVDRAVSSTGVIVSENLPGAEATSGNGPRLRMF